MKVTASYYCIGIESNHQEYGLGTCLLKINSITLGVNDMLRWLDHNILLYARMTGNNRKYGSQYYRGTGTFGVRMSLATL